MKHRQKPERMTHPLVDHWPTEPPWSQWTVSPPMDAIAEAYRAGRAGAGTGPGIVIEWRLAYQSHDAPRVYRWYIRGAPWDPPA